MAHDFFCNLLHLYRKFLFFLFDQIRYLYLPLFFGLNFLVQIIHIGVKHKHFFTKILLIFSHFNVVVFFVNTKKRTVRANQLFFIETNQDLTLSMILTEIFLTFFLKIVFSFARVVLIFELYFFIIVFNKKSIDRFVYIETFYSFAPVIKITLFIIFWTEYSLRIFLYHFRETEFAN